MLYAGQHRKVLCCCQKYDLNLSLNVHIGKESEFNGVCTIIAVVIMNLIDYHTWTSTPNNCNYMLGIYSMIGTNALSLICITVPQGTYYCPYFTDLETEA